MIVLCLPNPVRLHLQPKKNESSAGKYTYNITLDEELSTCVFIRSHGSENRLQHDNYGRQTER